MEHFEQTICECKTQGSNAKWVDLHKEIIDTFWLELPKITSMSHPIDDKEFRLATQYAEALLVQLRAQIRLMKTFELETYLLFNTKMYYVCDRLLKMDYRKPSMFDIKAE